MPERLLSALRSPGTDRHRLMATLVESMSLVPLESEHLPSFQLQVIAVGVDAVDTKLDDAREEADEMVDAPPDRLAKWHVPHLISASIVHPMKM